MQSISNIAFSLFGGETSTSDDYIDQGKRNIIAGILLNLVIGSGFCWGSITTYVATYFWYIENDDTVDLGQNTYALTFFRIFCMIMMLFIPKLSDRYDASKIVAAAAIIISLGLLVSGFCSSTFLMFQVLFGITQGIGQGLLIFLPIKVCWEFFPNSKGLISGIMLGAFGFSTFIFNILSILIINPQNQSVEADGFYTPEIARNIPMYFLMIVIFYNVLLFFGWYLLKEKPKDSMTLSAEGYESQICPSYYEIVFGDKIFFYLFTMNLLSIIYPFFMEAEYKVFGQLFINDDSFLTDVGSVASFCSALRFIWSFMLDSKKLDYFQLQFIVVALQSLLSLFTYISAQNKYVYMALVGLTQVCYGAPFVMLPVHCNNIATSKAHGMKLYSLVFSFGAFSSYIMSFIDEIFTKYDISIVGRPNQNEYKDDGAQDPSVYRSVFLICFILNIISLLMLRNYAKMMKKQSQVDQNGLRSPMLPQ